MFLFRIVKATEKSAQPEGFFPVLKWITGTYLDWGLNHQCDQAALWRVNELLSVVDRLEKKIRTAESHNKVVKEPRSVNL